MPDLRELLDRAAGDPPDLPDVDLIRGRGNALRWRRRVRWAAGALAASLLVAATVTSLQHDPVSHPVPAGTPTPMAPQVANACAGIGTPATGDLAFTVTRPGLGSAVQVASSGGGPGRCLVDTAGTDSWPAWSPDGQWLAFVGGDGIHEAVYVVRADGSDLSRVTDGAGAVEGPIWSPDGRRLGYTVPPSRAEPSSIHVVGRDGRSDQVVLRGPDPGIVRLEDWSPDGQSLLFIQDASSEGGHIALWEMAADGSDPRLLRAENGDFGSGARYSPDGSQVAFHADLDGGCVYRSDPLVERLTKVTSGCSQGGSLSWSPDGTRLAVAGGNHGPAVLVVTDLEAGGQRAITTGSTASGVDWRPVPTE